MYAFEQHRLSLNAFKRYAMGWPIALPDYISLSQYSIFTLVEQADKIQSVGLPLYLRAAALKRENDGASQFIFWSFASAPPPNAQTDIHYSGSKIKPAEEPLHGIGEPTGEAFQIWRADSSANRLIAPIWDLPILVDCADDFLHLVFDLQSVCDDDWRLHKEGAEDGGVRLAEVLNQFVYFEYWDRLMWLAREVLKRAEDQYQEEPVDLLLQAFEGIGLATRRTTRSEDVAKTLHSSSRKVRRFEGNSDEGFKEV